MTEKEAVFAAPKITENRSLADWHDAWINGRTRFDAGEVSPALVEVVDKYPIPKRGVGLVPGCGKGYDVVFLAEKLQMHVYGADISPKAIEEATNFANGAKDVTFAAVDFFDFSNTLPGIDPSIGKEMPLKYDLIFDYTFLCALDPTQRPAWVTRMAQLIKAGGILITLQFPVFPSEKEAWEGGPPWGLTLKLYDELLSETFEKVYAEKPTKSHPTRHTLEWIAVWKRKGSNVPKEGGI